MSVLSTEKLTLNDWAKYLDPNGSIPPIVEMLTQRNAFLEDAVFVEANGPTSHRFVSRTALPSVSGGWRNINQGIQPGKSKTDQVDEAIGMIDALSVVDKALLRLGGGNDLRAAEDKAFLAALSNEIESGIIYNSHKTSPEKFQGLAPRLDVTSGNPATNQIVKCPTGSTGSDQTSIWLISWSPDTVFCIFPKGSQAGILAEDMGDQLWEDSSGSTPARKYPARVTHWTWQIGLCVKDWRYLARGCNIDTSGILGTNDDLIPLMINMYSQLADTKTGKLVYYCNRKVYTNLWLQARNAVKNSTLSIEMVEGKPVMMFQGIPVKISDAIVNTEAIIT